MTQPNKPSERWMLCPACESKTRVKTQGHTELKNFPLFSPKCEHKTLIDVN
ncbi:MAG: hypothetical protein KHY12_03310 [Firmicutes bacterium]|nr:hypothetical protein [Bacillota bacterium]